MSITDRIAIGFWVLAFTFHWMISVKPGDTPYWTGFVSAVRAILMAFVAFCVIPGALYVAIAGWPL